MTLPLRYNLRNLRVRWRVSLLAVLGVALVVAVFTVLMAMSEGFATALRSTGRADNAIIIQSGTPSEAMSTVRLEQRLAIVDDARIARGADGRALASWEATTVMALRGKRGGRRINVTLRVVPPQAFEVRGGIRITEGRRFEPGFDEVIVGRRIRDRVLGLALGSTVHYRRRELRVVGVFDSDGAAFESEVWGDYDSVGSAFRRGTDSKSLIVRMNDAAEIPALDRFVRGLPGMPLHALPEPRYYANQAGAVSNALRALAAFVSLVMSAGAVFGAMNTMYAVVAARTREIGTLRAIGFSRASILLSFVAESAALALVGGALGCLLASLAHGYSTSTANVQSFSEVAYAFRVTPTIVASGMAFALAVGVAGGLLPAVRASRLPIASALREA